MKTGCFGTERSQVVGCPPSLKLRRDCIRNCQWDDVFRIVGVGVGQPEREELVIMIKDICSSLARSPSASRHDRGAASRSGWPVSFLEGNPGRRRRWLGLSVGGRSRSPVVRPVTGTEVVVIDIDKDAVVGSITNTPGVHGMAVASDLQRGFTSNGREDKSSVVDLKTLETLSKVETGKNPDGMLYEPGQHEVYMFNGRGQSATVIDAKTAKVVATIPLAGRPEFPAADPKAGRVYDNLEDKSLVVAIDTKTHQVVNTWPIAPGEEPSGLAIDVANHRLFLGCGQQIDGDDG